MKKYLLLVLILPFVLNAQITPTTATVNQTISTMQFSTSNWDSNPNYAVCFYNNGGRAVGCNSATNVAGALGVENLSWWTGGAPLQTGQYKILLLDNTVPDWGTIYNQNYIDIQQTDAFVENNGNYINIVPYDISGGFLLYISDILRDNVYIILSILGALIGLGFILRLTKRELGNPLTGEMIADYDLRNRRWENSNHTTNF